MKLTKFFIYLFPLLSASHLACANPNWLNDYPTQVRVEYVLGCMNLYGGENYNRLYSCTCAFDKIASKIKFEDYVSIQTLSVIIKTPGEKGGAFRDIEGGRKSIRDFQDLIKTSERSCGLNS